MDEIVPGVFLGDLMDAKNAPSDMLRICVLEYDFERAASNTMHVPILNMGLTLSTGNVHASAGQLHFIARIIHYRLEQGKTVLVHCGAGIERSPLAVAFYLHRYHKMSMDEAYSLIASKRPMIQRRDDVWFPFAAKARKPATSGAPPSSSKSRRNTFG